MKLQDYTATTLHGLNKGDTEYSTAVDRISVWVTANISLLYHLCKPLVQNYCQTAGIKIPCIHQQLPSAAACNEGAFCVVRWLLRQRWLPIHCVPSYVELFATAFPCIEPTGWLRSPILSLLAHCIPLYWAYWLTAFPCVEPTGSLHSSVLNLLAHCIPLYSAHWLIAFLCIEPTGSLDSFIFGL